MRHATSSSVPSRAPWGGKSLLPALGAALALLAWAAPGRADVIFSGTSGGLSASADFSLSGSTLTVTLTNTSATTALVPADVLTGVFFDSAHTLTPTSAAYPNGSTIWYGTISTPSGTGDGWGYATGVAAQGKNSAISASGAVSGLGHSNFSGANNPLQGLDYGILPAGYTGVGANTGITGHGPLIQNSVVFTLTVPSGFDLAELGNDVAFQYGTQLSEPSFAGLLDPNAGGNNGGNNGNGGVGNGGPSDPSAPEPSSLALLALGGAALAGWRRWKGR
jgi:hypothetical protein